jgi:hypothetical protein
MKNYPLVIILLLTFLGVTAFAVSDKQAEKSPLPASSRLLDQLTDELLYLEELASTAETRLLNEFHAQLAGDISSTYQKKNREICQLIIAHRIPAKREISEQHEKSIAILLSSRREAMNVEFANLLRAEFDKLDQLIKHQRGLIEDSEIADFVDQLLTTQEDFRQKIGILQ